MSTFAILHTAMQRKKLRIATRSSPLALWQANFVRKAILAHHSELTIELLQLTTSGDQFLQDKLLTVGGKGLFVKELEEALLDGRADLAVHSMKDVPSKLPPGLSIPIICQRANPFDALVSTHYQSITKLPQDAIVGTVSLRRQAQLLAIRPDLRIKALRGNLQTRISKLNAGEYDAIILAISGLERMGLEQLISEPICEEIMLPACGQGALGIECRTDDDECYQYITKLHDENTAHCVTSERYVNALLGGHCHAPVAVYCSITNHNQLHLCAKVLAPDGSSSIVDTQIGRIDQGLQLAKQCAENLLSQGAQKLIALGLP